MSNMGYCTFENTSNDMKQAMSKLVDVLEGLEADMSSHEINGLHRLVDLAGQITALVADAALSNPRFISPLTNEAIAERKFVTNLANCMNSDGHFTMITVFSDTIDKAVAHGQLLSDEHEALDDEDDDDDVRDARDAEKYNGS